MKKSFLALLLSLTPHSVFATASDNELVLRGEYLARAGDCVACHTAKGGQPFAGGLPMATPIGTIYSTNITPDKQTGIGNYSYDDFAKAVRQGIAKNGDTLYPAMPYPSYAVISDQDTKALYAYFMHGVAGVEQQNKAVDIAWPLSMRWPLAIWRKMFAPDVKEFTPLPEEDEVISRGRYLVEGLAHCGACHTPRSFALQEKVLNGQDNTLYLAGSNGPIEGWSANNLRGDNRDGLGRWGQQDLEQFLRYGRNDHSAAFGGMTEVVKHSLQFLTPEDITAIAQYIKTLAPQQADGTNFTPDDRVAKALWQGDDHQTGASEYVDSCAACHKTDGTGYRRFFPQLQGNPVVLNDDPTSLIRIILTGARLPGVDGAPTAITMPAFGWRLNDQQVADLANFVRNSWGNTSKSNVTTDDVARLRVKADIEPQQGSSSIERLEKAH